MHLSEFPRKHFRTLFSGWSSEWSSFGWNVWSLSHLSTLFYETHLSILFVFHLENGAHFKISSYFKMFIFKSRNEFYQCFHRCLQNAGKRKCDTQYISIYSIPECNNSCRISLVFTEYMTCFWIQCSVQLDVYILNYKIKHISFTNGFSRVIFIYKIIFVIKQRHFYYFPLSNKYP